jgi:hypothetical protein
MCDNGRECEAAKRQGFGGPRREGLGGDAHSGHQGHGRHGGHHGGCGSTAWHGEWRGREMVDALLAAFGAEVTVLDAEDRVVAFSGGDRIFGRSDDLLGESVHGCHPVEARAGMREVLDALRAGEAERRRQVTLPDGSLVLVRYAARRGADGAYLGAVQVASRAEPNDTSR